MTDQNQRWLGDFSKSGFLSRGLGIFLKSGIFFSGTKDFYPGTGNFSISGDLYPRDWGFLSTGFFGKGDFLGMDFFIRGIGYPNKKLPLDQNLLYKIYYYLKINYGRVGQRKFRLVRFLQDVFDFWRSLLLTRFILGHLIKAENFNFLPKSTYKNHIIWSIQKIQC